MKSACRSCGHNVVYPKGMCERCPLLDKADIIRVWSIDRLIIHLTQLVILVIAIIATYQAKKWTWVVIDTLLLAWGIWLLLEEGSKYLQSRKGTISK